MKPRIYFGLALLFPYILWLICLLIVFLLSSQEVAAAWNILLLPITYYTFGIIYWLFPYTLLAFGMWIWSKNKSITEIYRIALLAPLLLFALMCIEAALFSLPADNVTALLRNTIGAALLLGAFSLLFGYLSVGVALGLFKFLQSKHLIREAETLLLSGQ
jgi:hypothetical protein